MEAEMLSRIDARAKSAGGFQLGASDFDLRIPQRGEPEEIIGPSIHAAGALAVGSARVEPLDSIASREEVFKHARYELRLEDRRGNCLIVHRDVAMDSTFVKGRRVTERCQPLYMAEVIRRARRIARLPFSAGRLDDHWTAAFAVTGIADVYMDSVVLTTSSIALRASYPVPETAAVKVDSISAGIGSGDASWSVVRQSPALRVDTTLHKNGEWRRQSRRFVVPIDESFALKKAWPLFQVHLSVPLTTENPYGQAWTYAHERKGFFAGVSVPER
jgi:hypothetical protein